MASAVAGSRFKTSPVTKRVAIKAFVETNKLSFKKGRGFYQLSKPEVVQDYKEIIIRRKSDGALITGENVRGELGIPKSSKKLTLNQDELPDFDVFVQSTSVNRVLLPGTDFLYEVEDEPAKVREVGCMFILCFSITIVELIKAPFKAPLGHFAYYI